MTRDKTWTLARHLSVIDEKLMAVAAGDIKRLMLCLPPRHGKSELVSHYFPAWYVGLFPDQRVILTSYEADFAASWGRKARDVLIEFASVFEVRVNQDSAAANHWDIYGHAGGMDTAGVGGPITGKGANVLIIDDPVKNGEEATSALMRDKLWDWYRTTARTRLEPRGAVILIMTRWHPDDLAGKLLKQMESDGERWDVVSLSAIAEDGDLLDRKPGQALWPERYNQEELAETKKAVSLHCWSAEYQQRPIPREGVLFQRDWFGEPIFDYPHDVTLVRYWDPAATKEGDYTAGALVAEKDGIYYIVDMQRVRTRPAGVEQHIRQTAERDRERGDVAIFMEQEPGASGVSMIDNYARKVLKGFPFTGDKTSGSKIVRAHPASSAAELGNIKLLQGAWITAFLDEAEAFPHGEHDDQIDALSGAIAMLTAENQKSKVPLIAPTRVGHNTRWDLFGSSGSRWNSSVMGRGRITRR
jgi:predicted phage terminase large subunit-like protein